MHLAIIGTRGIPNNYGGFEQCAEYLAVGLVQRGFDVTVYNSHNHPYQEKTFNGVEIIHCYDPEFLLGTIGQFVYDFNCILNSRFHKYDIILQLGYTSNSIWGLLLPSSAIITTNMDGLEWKRSKYSRIIKNFLQYAEKLAVKYSDYLISDSIGIRDYLFEKYKKDSVYIPYGANLFNDPDEKVLNSFSVECFKYNLLIARLEPENSIEIILDGVIKSGNKDTFLVIGNQNTKYGNFLKEKYSTSYNIKFIGSIYDINILNNLRNYSNIYFHGHTVGGTNPSLLESMASNALICANKNPFNESILNDDALYFINSEDVAKVIIDNPREKADVSKYIEHNRNKIETLYSWDKIIDAYISHFKEILNRKINKSK
jgi:glycosyltransferase involved in cell wall biosynthesis